uniref:Movement protein BC1 n=1 Tax=East African cassava mosaic Kenya virus TaxID=393599 RepID=I6LZI1_9GEMI|nr:movement protein [East African cassava mosaic Kenya virus]
MHICFHVYSTFYKSCSAFIHLFSPFRNPRFFIPRMDNTFTVTDNNYIHSKRTEYALTNDAAPIHLQFPSSFEQATMRLKGRCMKIDHIIIEYRNQVPFNATGSVIVEIRDDRVSLEDAAQAAFTFPIACNVDLHYFSSTYFSISEPSPWRIMYRVEDSNVVEGVKFASIKAKLRLSSAKHSTDIRFKPPTINILSKGYTKECIDFWSVEKGETRRRLLNPTPTAHSQRPITNRPITILPGETWATKSQIGLPSSSGPARLEHFRSQSMRMDPSTTQTDLDNDSIEYPYQRLHRLSTPVLDPGDSVSQTQSRHRLTEGPRVHHRNNNSRCLIKTNSEAPRQL